MQVHPADLAYDRPSSKLVPFLAKHYSLSRIVQQSNNYVVFEDYFERSAERQMTARFGSGARSRSSSGSGACFSFINHMTEYLTH